MRAITRSTSPADNDARTTVLTEGDSGLVGREREQAELDRTIADVSRGGGDLILLAGEAGVGKTRLAQETLARSDLLVIGGASVQGATEPYGPITAALRAYLRIDPDGLANCGPLAPYLALLLPELGPVPSGGDRSTLFEAIRSAYEAIASHQPTAMFLDDLQWADNTTLELLPALAGSLERAPLLILGAYRSDEIPRGHPLRRMRIDLRRAGRLREIPVEPLDREGTAALVARVLGAPPDVQLASILYDRTQGVPFFVEELAAALAASGRLRRGTEDVTFAVGEDVPIPDTVRDAVLLRVEGLSDKARRALEVAAVAGAHFDLDLVADLAEGEEGLGEAIESGVLREADRGRATFRHVLAREALYGDIAWTGRRALHRQIAGRLEPLKAAPGLIAEHWLAAREYEPARAALIASAEAYCVIHAHRDALQAGRRALEVWAEGLDEAGRLQLLDRLGECAELSGDLSQAIGIWREVAEAHRRAGHLLQAGQVERRLANVYELQTAWERALTTRQAAAAAFAASGFPGDASAERLMVAAHLQTAGSFTAALELITVAMEEAEGAERLDLQARALALEGAVRAKLGQVEYGVEKARAGLSLALRENLTAVAAETYQRLAAALEHAADYEGARSVYLEAVDFCQAQGVTGMGQVCMACLAVVLTQLGEWQRAVELCRDVLARSDAPIPARIGATGILGWVHAMRGEAKRARRLLTEAVSQAQRYQMAAMQIISLGGLAWVDDIEGMHESAADRCHSILGRREQTEERHYAVAPLRWAATVFAREGAAIDARACAEALARIAAATGNPEAVAALAHALGEVALLEGDIQQATLQFGQALELLRDLELPFERAQTQLRSGIALAAAGERGTATERITDAYRTARKLGSQPLAARAAEELAALGERIERRLGRRAAGRLERGGLSRREVEVLRMIAAGHTNREIAQELFLSARTIDMHVSNILTKLDCRSRADATRRASELGLLQSAVKHG